MYCECRTIWVRRSSGTTRRNFFDFLQFRCGCGVIGVLRQRGPEGCDRGVWVALKFTDQPENELVTASLRVSCDRLAGVIGCFGELFQLEFDECHLDVPIGVVAVDHDGPLQRLLGGSEVSDLVVGESKVVVRPPEARVSFQLYSTSCI